MDLYLKGAILTCIVFGAVSIQWYMKTKNPAFLSVTVLIVTTIIWPLFHLYCWFCAIRGLCDRVRKRNNERK